MNLHEYQAKIILSDHGIPVPRGGVATSPGEAKEIAHNLGGKAVIKAQVHAGGRGKAGGIKLVSSDTDAENAARSLLGTNLVTFQTNQDGVPINQVLVEEIIEVKQELYLGMLIDGSQGGVVLIASEAGGMDIEEVAETSPEKIHRIAIDPVLGIQPFQARKLSYGLRLRPELMRSISSLIFNLYKLFQNKDCALVEINPLVVTSDDRMIAVDAKINFDDDALFRQKDVASLRDPKQEDPLEVESRNADISYVKLDGDVGCMVNGAGLAMATMDVIQEAGASPANFLDVGGGANEEKVAKAMQIILSDPNVKCVLINLFGGILRCDVAARGILLAIEIMPTIKHSIVVRMLGTNADEGREILKASNLPVILVDDLEAAAKAIRTAM